MARHLVCLTFDFDTHSPLIQRGLTTPTSLSRGEFGVVGAGRILALLARYGIRATWFTPGYTIETFPEMARRVHDAGHEFAHHGWTHTPPANLTREEEAAELARGNETIRTLTGRVARGYRSPSWDLSPHTVELLLEHGFVYDSSMMGHDYLPYRARQGDVLEPRRPMRFGRETPLVEMPISWTLDDAPHFLYLRMKDHIQPGLMATAGVLQNWLDDFEYMTRVMAWGVLTYTFHPFVIGRGYTMLLLERLVLGLLERGAAFLAMEEAVEEFVRRFPPGSARPAPDGTPAPA
jgi:peptidoglycan/xylan/chitin deacetylase (PgdA/CDA1 family)